jgi:hypothetical protein
MRIKWRVNTSISAIAFLNEQSHKNTPSCERREPYLIEKPPTQPSFGHFSYAFIT